MGGKERGLATLVGGIRRVGNQKIRRVTAEKPKSPKKPSRVRKKSERTQNRWG